MKQSESIWVQNLARLSLGKSTSQSNSHQIGYYSVSLFFEELCQLMMKYSLFFNELIKDIQPDACIQIFQTAQPRPSLIILKGGDKMVISIAGKIIRVRTVQVHVESDRKFQSYDFEQKFNEHSSVIWRCNNDGQIVNPELVAQNYLSAFLALGCSAVPPQTLRLVVSSNHT